MNSQVAIQSSAASIADQVASSRAFSDPKWADFTIRYVEAESAEPVREWLCHSVVLCPQSIFLDVCLDAAKGFQESIHRIVPLSEVPGGPGVVDACLRFLYTGDYDDASDASLPPSMFNIHVHTFMDFLDLRDARLRIAACTKFRHRIETCGNLDEFSQAMRLLYHDETSQNADLRAILISVVENNCTQLFPRQPWEALAVFHQALRETPSCGAELCDRFMAIATAHWDELTAAKETIKSLRQENATKNSTIKEYHERAQELGKKLALESVAKQAALTLAAAKPVVPANEARYRCDRDSCGKVFQREKISAVDYKKSWCPYCHWYEFGSSWAAASL